MDGFRKRLSESIQLRLSISLAIAVVVVALLAGIFAFVSAFGEANDLQDDTLREVAALLGRLPVTPTHGADVLHADDVDEDVRVIYQPLGSGTLEGALPFQATLPDGLQTLDIEGIPLRAYVTTKANGERFVVAQKANVRNEIAGESAFRTLAPILVLVPILVFVVARLVRQMFGPITALSAEVDARDVHDLHPVPEVGLPLEVRPFVKAINRLLSRVRTSMDVQRRFVADAAHEIRTPMTAISLQAERLSKVEMSAEARERLGTLRRGIERGRNLLDQLLTLARSQDHRERPRKSVALQDVCKRVLEDMMPLAEAKRVDLGVEGGTDAQLWADEADLVAMVKNLVDNAIRYSPEGGRVDLSVSREDSRVMLEVRDAGPGIPPEKRERVFDAFYRVLGEGGGGSGLGLAIVKSVAERLGAEIRLAYCDEDAQTGLRASVVLRVALDKEPAL